MTAVNSLKTSHDRAG